MKTSILLAAITGLILYAMYDCQPDNGLVCRPRSCAPSLAISAIDSTYRLSPLEAQTPNCFNLGYVTPPGKIETIKFNTRDFR